MVAIKIPAELKATVRDWESSLFGGKEIVKPPLKQTAKLTLGQYLDYHENAQQVNDRPAIYDSFRLNASQTIWTVKKQVNIKKAMKQVDIKLKKQVNIKPAMKRALKKPAQDANDVVSSTKVSSKTKVSNKSSSNKLVGEKDSYTKKDGYGYTKRYRLAYQKLYAKRLKSEGFKQFGDNSDSAIKALTHLNTIPIKMLENRLKPTDYASTHQLPVGRFRDTSAEGFLKDHDHLLNVLVQDNQTVHKHKLTHQRIIEPLIDAYLTFMERPSPKHSDVYRWSANNQNLQLSNPKGYGRDSQQNPFLSMETKDDFENQKGEMAVLRYEAEGARIVFFGSLSWGLFGPHSKIFVELNDDQTKWILAPATLPKPEPSEMDLDMIPPEQLKGFMQRQVDKWKATEITRSQLRKKYKSVFEESIWPILKKSPTNGSDEALPITVWPAKIITQLTRITDEWLAKNPEEAERALGTVFRFGDRHLPNRYQEPVILTNLGTKESIQLHTLTLSLIWQFGFYQNGPYRLDPKTLISILGL